MALKELILLKQEIRKALSFSEYEKHWRRKTWNVAESTRGLRLSIMDKEMQPYFGERTLKESSPTDLRILCEEIRDRGAPFTALNVRHLVSKVFEFAIFIVISMNLIIFEIKHIQ